MDKKRTDRMVIYAKDILVIIGKGERTARKLMGRIKARNNKCKEDMVTVDEFCEYTGLKKAEVERVIRG